MYQIGVFISHSWKYSNHYDTLAEWIFQKKWSVKGGSIEFIDYSIPKHDPIHNAQNATALQYAINNEIANSHVVVIPMGMYTNYSKWIQKEINGSRQFGKPILAVNPRAQERKASVVADAATKEVGWSSDSVVGAIWNLYCSR
jgi:hypothetical protein